MRSQGAKILKFSLVWSMEWRMDGMERRMTKRERMALGDKSGTFRAFVLFGMYPAAVPFTLDTAASVRSWGKTLPPLKFEKTKKVIGIEGKKERKYWKIFSWFFFNLSKTKSLIDEWQRRKEKWLTKNYDDNNRHHITMRIMAQRPKADRSKDFLLYYHPIRCSILYTTVYFYFLFLSVFW